MATNFPTSLDSLTNPTASDKLNSVTVPHASQHADINDAVEALEAKVGVDGSAVTSSLDYKMAKQSVVPYDDASARTAAVPSPVEGEVSYLKDTNTVEVYDGSSWRAVADVDFVTFDSTNARVGINSASPSRSLEVQSSQGIVANFQSTEASSYITLTNSGSTDTTQVRVGAVDDQLRLFAGGAETVRIDSSGNVGINDATPSYKLDVDGDINATGDLRIGGTAIGEWQTYSPSCSWSSYGSFDFVKYAQVNKTVYLRFQFVLTGTPSGLFEFEQPVVEVSGEAPAGTSGTAMLEDATGDNYIGFMYITGADVRITTETSGGVDATAPFTWASGDEIRGLMIYEAS